MRAMVFTGPGAVELQDVGEPAPGDGEVVVSVEAVGICGSELHGALHPGFRTPPLVMGHEFAGTTPDGRRVVANPFISCGRCDLCRRGLFNVCRERSIVGIHRPGAFAERVAVPADRLLDLPDGMGWEAATLVEPLANAVHAWRIASDSTDERVGVIGAGAIGLVCLLTALNRGASSVHVADLAPERLEVARKLGATATSAALDGEFDIVFDAVGHPATRRSSVDRLRPGGTAVWIGLLDPDPGFDSLGLVRGEKRVIGSYCYTDLDFQDALRLATGLDDSWTRPFPLDSGPEIFTELMHGRTDVTKAILRP